MKRKTNLFLSFLLSASMIITSVNVPVFAEDTTIENGENTSIEAPEGTTIIDNSESSDKATQESIDEISADGLIESISNSDIANESNTILASGTMDGFTWELDEEGTLNISGNGEMHSYANGDYPWYQYRYEINKIVLGNGITSIGNQAFYCCLAREVILPDSLISIGSGAFFDSNITSLSIPDSVTSIGQYAFSGCGLLEELKLSKGLTSIGVGVFEDCASLKVLVIPDNITGISEMAFYGCSGLKSIIISESVDYVGPSAFFGCMNLKNVFIPKSVTSIKDYAFCCANNVSKSDYTIYGYEGSEAQKYASNKGFNFVQVSDNGRTGEGIIWLTASLNNTDDTLLFIGYGTMDTYNDEDVPWCNASGLVKKVIIKDGISTISDNAFKGFNELQTVEISETVTGIGCNAFESCNNLISITIPNSVSNIGNLAFYNCHALTIYGYQNSYAETYASDNMINFYALDGTGNTPDIDINKRSIATFNISLSYLTTKFDGTEKRPDITISDNDIILTAGADYSLTYNNNIIPGTASVIVTGIGNYIGELEKTFTIEKADQENFASISNTNIIMGETAEITCNDAHGAVTYATSDNNIATINEGIVTPVAPGTATITVTAAGDENYNEKTITFDITVEPDPISLMTATLSYSSTVYDGSSKEPTVTLTKGETVFTEGTDYSVSYENNIDAGTATVKIILTGDYSGTIEKTFAIEKADQDDFASITREKIAMGNTATITCNGNHGTLIYTTADSSIASVNDGIITPVAPGSTTISVTAAGDKNYNAKTISFNITVVSTPISSFTASLSYSSTTYNGSKKEPKLTVKDGDYLLVKDTDYTAVYKNNINAGTASVVITGIGNYTGTITKTFTIKKAEQGDFASISSKKIVMGETAVITCTGSQGTVSYTTSDKTVAKVSKGIVTTVTPGTATIKVTAAGNKNYNKKTISFTISVVRYTPEIETIKNTSSGIEISWKAVSGCSGCTIYRSIDNGKYSKLTDLSADKYSYNDTNTTTGKNYSYKIKLSYVSGTSKQYSNYSKAISIIRVARTKISSCTNTTTGIKISWKAVKGVSGYQVFRSTDGKNYTKIKTLGTSSLAYTDKSAVEGTSYSYKIKSFCKANGTYTYSTYSTAKSIKRSMPAYTIKFNGNGATSGSMKSMTSCKYGQSYTLNSNTFERTGYDFTGWNTKADGSGTKYKNSASVKNLSSTNGKVITLYAQWKKYATPKVSATINAGLGTYQTISITFTNSGSKAVTIQGNNCSFYSSSLGITGSIWSNYHENQALYFQDMWNNATDPYSSYWQFFRNKMLEERRGETIVVQPGSSKVIYLALEKSVTVYDQSFATLRFEFANKTYQYYINKNTSRTNDILLIS